VWDGKNVETSPVLSFALDEWTLLVEGDEQGKFH
jgi:hypothetical protein